MFVSTLRRFCLIIDWLSKMAGYAASVLMPLLAFIVSFEVFCRYFLNRPSIWAFDFSLFLFGYIAILGGAYAHQKRAHITVDILYKHVSPNTRRVFDVLSFLLALFFLLLIIDLSYTQLLDAIKFGTRRESEWAPPMHHFWIMTMFACSLFSLQLVRDIIDNIYGLITGHELTPDHRLLSAAAKGEDNHGN